MKLLVRAYFDEAKWFHQDYIPTMEEYMHVALRTTAHSMLTAVSFLGMGDIVTKEAFEWISSNPKSVTGSSVIGRLMDDMKTHKVCNQKIIQPYVSVWQQFLCFYLFVYFSTFCLNF